MIDEILKKFGVKSYGDLTDDERGVFDKWMEVLQRKELTIGDIRGFIAKARDIVEDKLTETTHNKNEDIFLKARLKNYRLIDAFLSSPEKAKEEVNKQISSITGNREV